MNSYNWALGARLLYLIDGSLVLEFLRQIASDFIFDFQTIIGSFLLDDIDCIGTEENLAQCKRLPWGSENCGQSEHVVVNCSSESKLCFSFFIPGKYASKFCFCRYEQHCW